jgi:hypothetical protein
VAETIKVLGDIHKIGEWKCGTAKPDLPVGPRRSHHGASEGCVRRGTEPVGVQGTKSAERQTSDDTWGTSRIENRFFFFLPNIGFI